MKKHLLVLLLICTGLTGCYYSGGRGNSDLNPDDGKACYLVHIGAKATGKPTVSEENYMWCTEKEAKDYVAARKESLANKGYGKGTITGWCVRKDDSYCD